MQTAYAGYPTAGNGLPTTEVKAGKVISLPMHPYLQPEVQDRIIDAIKAFG
jgi:dTDP-4-amino-4,6-dideoxygalactose transaminase